MRIFGPISLSLASLKASDPKETTASQSLVKDVLGAARQGPRRAAPVDFQFS